MSLTHMSSQVSLQKRDNFVRFARGVIMDPEIYMLMSEENRNLVTDLINKVAAASYEELRTQISSRIAPARLYLGKGAGDYSVSPEDLIKLMLYQNVPAEFYRAFALIQVKKLEIFNKLMLYFNFMADAFGR